MLKSVPSQAPRNLFYGNTALESDSDVEDFRIMMEDSLKALNFTKNCVAQTVKSSRRILDSIEFVCCPVIDYLVIVAIM